MSSKLLKIAALWLFVSNCSDSSETIINAGDSLDSSNFSWNIPDSIPRPAVPEENPMTQSKFELGRFLFYDIRLSGNGSQSCSSCHEQELAFTHGLALAIGSTGQTHPRNSMALVNIAYSTTLAWANPSLRHLERQILGPLFGDDPVEQGINDDNLEMVIERLQNEGLYEQLFADAFPTAENYFTVEQIVDALASFVRGLTSFNSPFDQFVAGEISALSEAALRGRSLFFSEDLECFHCHGGYNFSNATYDSTTTFIERPFHNTGLFNTDGLGGFPDDNQGVFEITAKPQDMGKFKAVSLRNIEKTAPYMHDGSIETLSEVIDFYAAGGRNITSGPLAGDGRRSPLKDGFVTGFTLAPDQKQDLIEFLNSLTDQSFLTDEALSNPWPDP